MTICGADCNNCSNKATCKGCIETNGSPFGGRCVLAFCCRDLRGKEAKDQICIFKRTLIDEINALCVKGMPAVQELYALNGFFVNLAFPLPNGTSEKFLNDNDIYLGNQLVKEDSDHCFGISANDRFILVCEYGEGGTDPSLVLLKAR